MSTNLKGYLALHQSYAALQLKLNDELGTYHGINFNDFVLLCELADANNAPLSLATLGHSLGQRPSSVVRQLMVLEKIGLVERGGLNGVRHVKLRSPGRTLLNCARETVESVCTGYVESNASSAVARALSTLKALE